MYDWCIRAAEKPYATWLMGFISFIESSFFPIPPDTMLIPMSLARPDRAWFYAHVCTLTSVAGGVLGYFIEVGQSHADKLMCQCCQNSCGVRTRYGNRKLTLSSIPIHFDTPRAMSE